MFQLVHEYLFLQEPDLWRISQETSDKYISDLVLFRDYQDTVTIYFLWTSDLVIIPREYYVFARDLDVYCGERLQEKIPESPGEYFLWLLWKFFRQTDCSLPGNPLETLSGLLKVGTTKFQEKLSLEESLHFRDWTYKNK